MKTFVFGHKKPDLDSTVSAFVWAEFKKKTEKKKFVAGRTEPVNRETEFVFQKFNTLLPPRISTQEIQPEDRIILVDHNEESQRLEGINPQQIVEIIDHHRIDLHFPRPISLTIRPWGATATIIFWLGKKKKILPSPKTSALLLSAILSDTIGLRGPTTTDYDKKAVEELAEIAQIKDVSSLVREIFKAKSDIRDLTPKEVITRDYKIYNFAQKQVFIGQVETIEPEKILEEKEKYLKAGGKIKKEKKLDFVFLAITDVLRQNTKMLFFSKKGGEVLQIAFRKKGGGNVVDIGNRVSRKKEMAPEIERAIRDLFP